MANSATSFETGFEKPSLDNPMLFSRYADEIAARLANLYPVHAGYSVKVKKEEKEPRKRQWQVQLLKGWFTGAEVTIKPVEKTPHRANVKVQWHSRLLGVMINAFVIMLLPVLIVCFLAFAFMTRLGFALILTIVVAIALSIPGSLIIHGLARGVAAIFGDEFDTAARSSLAEKVKGLPLPQTVTARK